MQKMKIRQVGDVMQCDHHSWQLFLLQSNVTRVLIRFFVCTEFLNVTTEDVYVTSSSCDEGLSVWTLVFLKIICYGKTYILKIENSVIFQSLCEKLALFSTTLGAKI